MSSSEKIVSERKRSYKIPIVVVLSGIGIFLAYHFVTIITDPDYGCEGGRKINGFGLFSDSITCTDSPINVKPIISKQIVDEFTTEDKLEFTFGKGVNGLCVQVTHASSKGQAWNQYEHTCKVFIPSQSIVFSQGEPLPAMTFGNVTWVSEQKMFRPDGSLAFTNISSVNPAGTLSLFSQDESIGNNTLSKCTLWTEQGYECKNGAYAEWWGFPDNIPNNGDVK